MYECKCTGWVRPMTSSLIKQAQLVLALKNGRRAMLDFDNALSLFRANLGTTTAAMEQLREQILNSDSDTPSRDLG
jgi:hypothetical protein